MAGETETIEEAEVIDDKIEEGSEENSEEGGEKPAQKKEPSSQKQKSGQKTTPLPKQTEGSGLDDSGNNWDWGDNDDVINAFVQTPTKESTAESAEPHLENIDEASEEDVNAYIRGENEEEEEEALSEQDLLLASELVIELIDGLNSIAVGAFAKEPANRFELEGSKKKKLAIILAKVFYKYQAKIGPLATLIIALLLYLGMTWRMGYEVRRDKKAIEEEKRLAAKKEKNRQKKEAFRTKITSAIGVERLTLKEISKRMGENPGKIKPEISILCGNGIVFADHSETVIKYRIAE